MYKLPWTVFIIVLFVFLGLLFSMLIAVKSFFLKVRVKQTINSYESIIEDCVQLSITDYYVLFSIISFIGFVLGFIFAAFPRTWTPDNFIGRIYTSDAANLMLFRIQEHKHKMGWDDGVNIFIMDKNGKLKSDKEK